MAIEDSKQIFAAGQARNRTARAVERTIPFQFACQAIAVTWYATAGHDPADVDDHRARAPWYTTKAEPSTADMAAKLRRVLIAGISPRNKQKPARVSLPWSHPSHDTAPCEATEHSPEQPDLAPRPITLVSPSGARSRRSALFFQVMGVSASASTLRRANDNDRLSAFAAVVSYSHIYGLGRAHDQDGAAARLLPLSADGLILAASLVLLHEARNDRSVSPGPVHAVARHRRHHRRQPRLRNGLLGALISVWPPAPIGAVEIAMQLVRRSHGPRAATTVPDVPPVPGTAAGRRHAVPRRRMRR